VGCVIVFNNKIIGEGYHQKFGEPHAEVNAINDAIKKHGEDSLKQSTLYVSLEPCAHQGKTPPCSDLVINKKIPRVVIGCIDSFRQVNGKGIAKLQSAGVEVKTGILEKECREINQRFFTFHEKKRPFIILKYAQSKDGFLSPLSSREKIHWISNEYSRKLVHKWRSEEPAIMVGTNTALADNPQLTVRDWTGKNPVRIVIDRFLRLPSTLNIFDDATSTIIFNEGKNDKQGGIEWAAIDFQTNPLPEILHHLYLRNLQSVIVEGGVKLLQSLIDADLWDEARIFTGDQWLGEGIKAPSLKGAIIHEQQILNDHLIVLKNTNVL
jgi:diaminohydroxyphosphoribosylaminopyrimidine deaminase / 5-amino-6-(5-phosphoribosylamino)uracil reductase